MHLLNYFIKDTIQMETTIMEALHQHITVTTITTAVEISNAAIAMVRDNVPIHITMEVLALQAVGSELVLGQNKNLKKNDFYF